MNTILKTTQWQRPTQYVASNHGTGVRAVDTPAARSRESLTSSFSDVHESKQQEQARDLDDPVGAFPSAGTAPSAVSRLSVSAEDTSLPPNWEKRVNQDGKICESCRVGDMHSKNLRCMASLNTMTGDSKHGNN